LHVLALFVFFFSPAMMIQSVLLPKKEKSTSCGHLYTKNYQFLTFFSVLLVSFSVLILLLLGLTNECKHSHSDQYLFFFSIPALPMTKTKFIHSLKKILFAIPSIRNSQLQGRPSLFLRVGGGFFLWLLGECFSTVLVEYLIFGCVVLKGTLYGWGI
jgi:hypothetical protein